MLVFPSLSALVLLKVNINSIVLVSVDRYSVQFVGKVKLIKLIIDILYLEKCIPNMRVESAKFIKLFAQCVRVTHPKNVLEDVLLFVRIAQRFSVDSHISSLLSQVFWPIYKIRVFMMEI